MESRNYICGGDKFIYSKGYIGRPVVVGDLPEIFKINGESLLRKTSFHASLVCVKNILAVKPDAEQMILDEFCAFTRANEISFIKYTGEFRLAQNGERKTIVALCEVSNLDSFSELLSEKLGIEIPAQPTHVTLYTLQLDAGIGLNSPEDMESQSVRIEVPADIKEVLNI